MILSVGKPLKLVPQETFEWFVSKLRDSTTTGFSNGTGIYKDGLLVAASVGGKFYIRL